MASKLRLLRLSLAAVWLLTAIASIIYPHAQNIAMLEQVGLHGNWAEAALFAGIVTDMVLGVLTWLNLCCLQKWLWPFQAGVILSYSLIIAIFLPEHALHPFGVLIKNIPILMILWLLWSDTKKEETYV